MIKYLFLKEKLNVKSLGFFMHLFSDAKLKIAEQKAHVQAWPCERRYN